MRWVFIVVVQGGGAAAGALMIHQGARHSALYVLGLTLGLTGMMFGPRPGARRTSTEYVTHGRVIE